MFLYIRAPVLSAAFAGSPQVTTWLYRITTNAAIVRPLKEKRAKVLRQTSLDKIDVPDWSATPERSAVSSERSDNLRERIARLEPDIKAAVVLGDVE